MTVVVTAQAARRRAPRCQSQTATARTTHPEDPRVEDDRERVQHVDEARPAMRVGVEVVSDASVEAGQRSPLAQDEQGQQRERDGERQRRQAAQRQPAAQRSRGFARLGPLLGREDQPSSQHGAVLPLSRRSELSHLPGNDHGSVIISPQPWPIGRGRGAQPGRVNAAVGPFVRAVGPRENPVRRPAPTGGGGEVIGARRRRSGLATLGACSIPDYSVTTPTPYARRSAPEARTRASSTP